MQLSSLSCHKKGNVHCRTEWDLIVVIEVDYTERTVHNVFNFRRVPEEDRVVECSVSDLGKQVRVLPKLATSHFMSFIDDLPWSTD